MSADGYSIAQVFSVPAGGSENNIIANKPGVKLPGGPTQLSNVDIFLTREGVDVDYNVTIGGTNVYPQPGPANISTVAGSLPSTQNDKVISVLAQGGDEIVIAANNSNIAAQEARALVKVQPLDAAQARSAQNLRLGRT